MPAVEIRSPQLNQLTVNLRRFTRTAVPRTNEAIKKSILVVFAQSARITPVDTGRLRSSYALEFGNLFAKIRVTANYAIFVHEGTSLWPLSIKPKAPGTVRQFLKVGIQKSTPHMNRFFAEANRKIAQDIMSGI